MGRHAEHLDQGIVYTTSGRGVCQTGVLPRPAIDSCLLGRLLSGIGVQFRCGRQAVSNIVGGTGRHSEHLEQCIVYAARGRRTCQLGVRRRPAMDSCSPSRRLSGFGVQFRCALCITGASHC
uniref:Uncharacterized protein n=1 Tax=Alexandrium monilatum TaxID=311494 RepID=A0A7S4PSA7_9DINO